MAGTEALIWRKLLGWAYAVKARQPHSELPPLWLFSDTNRHPDLPALVARLPRGLCGVVLRHDAAPERAQIAAQVAAICRDRRLALAVGEPRLAIALHAGLHLRRGRRPWPGQIQPLTGSAHGAAELHAARRAGVTLAFLSPCFATASHPRTRPLGVVRWSITARRAAARGLAIGALGGIDGTTVRRLPRWCRAVGAIGAFSPLL